MDRGDAAGAEQVEPAADAFGHVVGERVAAGVERLRCLADERGQRDRADPVGALLLERLEQHQPLVGRLAEHHVAAAGDHRGDAVGGQRRADGVDPLDAGEQERDVAGLDRLALEGRAGAEQPRDVGREVVGDVLAQGVDADGAVAAGGEVLARQLTHAQRRGCRSAGQPAVLVVRLDVEDGDPRVAQLGAAAQLLQRVDQGRVAAPVGGQGPAGRSRPGGLEVGDDVAAAEGVDRLLGVTDQDQRRVAGEGAVEHLPLHRVGVLELVDEDDLPALAHPLAGRCVVVLERVGEPAEQVVVRQDAAAVLAPLDLVAHRLGEVDLGPRRAPRLGVAAARARPAGRRPLPWPAAARPRA